MLVHEIILYNIYWMETEKALIIYIYDTDVKEIIILEIFSLNLGEF